MLGARKAGVPPRQQQASALLGEQALGTQEREHPVAEHQRGRLAVDERDRRPSVRGVPTAAVDESMDVGMPGEVVAERLHHGDHAGTIASSAGRAAAIISRAVW